MPTEKLQSITVKILGRPYRLSISRDQEEALRSAAELINNDAQQYGKKFAYQDQQDLLAMVALARVSELIAVKQNLQFQDKGLQDMLDDVDSQIENYLHPSQNSL